MKKFGRYHFTHVYQSTPSPLPPPKDLKHQNFEKNEKKCMEIWKYYPFTHTHLPYINII